MRILPTCIIAVAASQLGVTDCDGGITRDPGFDLWCGDALCAWKLERGEIRRAATWHPGDAGVELVVPDTAIEQFTPATSRDGTCIRFDLISDAAEDAQAELAIDIYGDGSVERAYPIPTAHWKPVSFRFAIEAPFTGVRFEIAKRGPGRAVVARMHAVVVEEGCAGVPAIAGGPAPLGAVCDGNADCASAICATVDLHGRCAGCDPLAPVCAADQVCGLAEPGPAERAVPIACVPAGARVLGEQCLDDDECATGICTYGICSACGPRSEPCPGVACEPAYRPGPSLCGPGKQLGQPGAPCGTDLDCASGVCNGTERRQCADGRACVTDFNCPVDLSLRHLPCKIAGIQGGTCD